MQKILNIFLFFLAQLCVETWGQMTVSEYLSQFPKAKPSSSSELKGRKWTQETAGVHLGHQILSSTIPLCKDAQIPYAIGYSACLEKDKHSGAVDLTAKEGLSGIGISKPSGPNWYSGGFIDVLVNGRGLGNYRPRLERQTWPDGAVSASANWKIPQGRVTLRFLQRPGDDHVTVRATIESEEVNSLAVRLRCYPSGYALPRRRAVWSASETREGPGRMLVPTKDNWLFYGDTIHDRARDGRGRGACALMFSRSEVHTATVRVGNYPVDTYLSLRPSLKEFHLGIWEFPASTNKKALAQMRAIAQNLRTELGRRPTSALRTENVPTRALVVDGQPAASILIRANAATRETEAAVELQDYVAKATGAILPIVRNSDDAGGYVLRLRTRKPEEGESAEAFSVRTGKEGADITGNSPLAVLYGVYELLERGVGVRWYLPGELGEFVPTTSTLVLPRLELHESPSFPMRWIGTGRWMLHNKQNRCADGFNIVPGIYHTQNSLLPHRKYFGKHPEYFALINGTRSASKACKLCYSNPEVAREIARNMSAMLDADPGIDLISLSPTDGQMWCQCDGCRALDEKDVPADQKMSRRSMYFYNAVAEELRKTHPEARILVGAYNVYNWPPKDPTIKADPMLNVIITHYEKYCLAHPVPDLACPLNRRYVQLIRQWQSLGCGVFFYEYYWKVNWLDLPWPIVHSIKKDMPWYREQGCKGVYTQYTTSNIWSLYPAHYIAARLLWDVNADVDAIMEKMVDDLFGVAARQMKAYYALMEKQMAKCGKHFPGRGLSFGPAVFTDEVRARLREHYDRAVAVNRDQTVARRLSKIGISLEFVDRLMNYAARKRKANAEKDGARALSFAENALDAGEALVHDIRTDRGKWGGVVSASVVGTGYLATDLERWRKSVKQRQAAMVEFLAPLPQVWKFALDPENIGKKKGWSKEGFDDSAWKTIHIGRTWESQGHDYDGFAWYRISFTIKPEWAKQPLALHFAAVDGEAWVYWNGALLGHHKGWDEPFLLPLAPEQNRADRPNTIAVRVYDGANAGGIYKMAHLARGKKK